MTFCPAAGTPPAASRTDDVPVSFDERTMPDHHAGLRPRHGCTSKMRRPPAGGSRAARWLPTSPLTTMSGLVSCHLRW